MHKKGENDEVMYAIYYFRFFLMGSLVAQEVIREGALEGYITTCDSGENNPVIKSCQAVYSGTNTNTDNQKVYKTKKRCQKALKKLLCSQ